MLEAPQKFERFYDLCKQAVTRSAKPGRAFSTLQRYVSLHSWFSATWDVSSVTAAQPMLVCGLGFQVFAALLFSSGVSHMSMPTAGSDTLPLVVDADMEDPGQKHRGE